MLLERSNYTGAETDFRHITDLSSINMEYDQLPMYFQNLRPISIYNGEPTLLVHCLY